MSDKPKLNHNHGSAKFFAAYNHFPNNPRLQWNVSNAAYIEIVKLNKFISPLPFVDQTPSDYMGTLIFRYPVPVYLSNQLADGIAELVDLDTGDKATIDVFEEVEI